MRDEPVIAVVGASGLVGTEIVNLLPERQFSFSELKLLDSRGTALVVGSEVETPGSRVLDLGTGKVVEASQLEDMDISSEELNEDSFDGVDLVFFADTLETSAEYLPIALQAGATCIDCTSHSRLDPSVPLIVAGVNLSDLPKKTRSVAVPNAVAAELCALLAPIRTKAGLKRVVVSTYQAASGAGQAAMDELWSQSLAIFNQTDIEISHLPHQLAFNCIPQTEGILEDGYSKEELKVIAETRKILAVGDLPVGITCVRLPIFHGYALAINAETEKPLLPNDVAAIYQGNGLIEVFAAHDNYPMPISAVGDLKIQVGRIRKDLSVVNGICMWAVADNVRVCQALNAVMVAEHLSS